MRKVKRHSIRAIVALARRAAPSAGWAWRCCHCSCPACGAIRRCVHAICWAYTVAFAVDAINRMSDIWRRDCKDSTMTTPAPGPETSTTRNHPMSKTTNVSCCDSNNDSRSPSRSPKGISTTGNCHTVSAPLNNSRRNRCT